MNLTRPPGRTLRYAGELLGAFLAAHGAPIRAETRAGRAPPDLAVAYQPPQGTPLVEVLRGCPTSPTTLIANQGPPGMAPA